MEKEPFPKRVLVTEGQFIAALRVTILERLIKQGTLPTEENIKLFEKKAKETWIKIIDGREFLEWTFVLHDAARLSIENAAKK